MTKAQLEDAVSENSDKNDEISAENDQDEIQSDS